MVEPEGAYALSALRQRAQLLQALLKYSLHRLNTSDCVYYNIGIIMGITIGMSMNGLCEYNEFYIISLV
jgi:hypothetical protein